VGLSLRFGQTRKVRRLILAAVARKCNISTIDLGTMERLVHLSTIPWKEEIIKEITAEAAKAMRINYQWLLTGQGNWKGKE